MNIILQENLGDSPNPNNLVLDAIPEPIEQRSVLADVFWRWEDEPDMRPQPLGSVTTGNDLTVPFELKNRTIRVFIVPRNDEGQSRELSNMTEVPQMVYAPPTAPVLVALVFDEVEDNVQGTIANAGGAGTIRVLRRRTTETGFVEVQALATSATSFVDVPSINGTYEYKLIQDGLPGLESNKRSAVVDVGTPGTGSPPSGLTGSFVPISTVALLWSYNGGTGAASIERRINEGAFEVIATLADNATSYNDTVFSSRDPKLLYYRVSNAETDGFSNEAEVFIAGFEIA